MIRGGELTSLSLATATMDSKIEQLREKHGEGSVGPVSSIIDELMRHGLWISFDVPGATCTIPHERSLLNISRKAFRGNKVFIQPTSYCISNHVPYGVSIHEQRCSPLYLKFNPTTPFDGIGPMNIHRQPAMRLQGGSSHSTCAVCRGSLLIGMARAL